MKYKKLTVRASHTHYTVWHEIIRPISSFRRTYSLTCVNECLTALSLTVFTQRNFVADFLQPKCDFTRKTAVLRAPFGRRGLGTTYDVHLRLRIWKAGSSYSCLMSVSPNFRSTDCYSLREFSFLFFHSSQK